MIKSAGTVPEYSEVAARHASGYPVRACTPSTHSLTHADQIDGSRVCLTRPTLDVPQAGLFALSSALQTPRPVRSAEGTVAPLAVLKSCSRGCTLCWRPPSLTLGPDPLLAGDQMASTAVDRLPLAQARGACTLWMLTANLHLPPLCPRPVRASAAACDKNWNFEIMNFRISE
jgi:hypothetical protein